MLIVTNAVTLKAYKSPGNCIGWEEQSFPSSYRHNQSLCGLVDWALNEVQPRAWELCSEDGSSLRAEAELNLWQSDTSHLVWLVCFQWRHVSVCLCACLSFYTWGKILILLAKWGHSWGHFGWSSYLQRAVWQWIHDFKVEVIVCVCVLCPLRGICHCEPCSRSLGVSKVYSRSVCFLYHRKET